MDDLIDPYVDALKTEIESIGRAAQQPQRVRTLYFGGGTPSLLSPSLVKAVIDTLQASFSVVQDIEITLEANPETVDFETLVAYREIGINRLSLGVQSAHQHELDMFGRIHTFKRASKSFHLARSAGFENISVDLIYGIPDQTIEDWVETLNAVLEWRPEHISLYSLSIEPGTDLHQRVKSGEITPPDPDLAADMYEYARLAVDKAGFEHYEISNWARPGYQCLHNKQYWMNEPFLGFGAGAHGSAAGIRYWNVRPVPEYIRRITQEERGERPYPLSPAAYSYDLIDAGLEMGETLMLGLRLIKEGVSETDFAWRFGISLNEAFGEVIDRLVEQGLLTFENGKLLLTEKAYLVSNRVFFQFLPDQ